MRINGHIIGFWLFIVGIIGALIGAAKLPLSNENWSNMLPIVGGAIIIAMGGLLLLHWPQVSQKDNRKTQPNPIVIGSITDLLQALLAEMQILEKEINSLKRKQIIKKINVLLEKYVLPFATIQQDVICLLGHTQGVEVLVATARGERLLNRMLSAAYDRHLAEAIATYPKALTAFEEAYRQSQKVD